MPNIFGISYARSARPKYRKMHDFRKKFISQLFVHQSLCFICYIVPNKVLYNMQTLIITTCKHTKKIRCVYICTYIFYIYFSSLRSHNHIQKNSMVSSGHISFIYTSICTNCPNFIAFCPKINYIHSTLQKSTYRISVAMICNSIKNYCFS